MGIPSYFRYIIANYDNLLVKQPSYPLARLFLDLNCAIHPCVREVMKDFKNIHRHEMERKACRSVLDYIVYLVKTASPTTLLYIAIDGVAPRAKMVQQRSRRFKSWREFQELEQLKKRFEGDSYNACERWDTNAITPGTSFMELLSKYLQKELSQHPDIPKSLNILLSDTNEPGEGEHKILQYLKNNPLDETTADAIYGLDADLIMLSMSSRRQNIYLFRETIEFNNVIKKNDESLPVMLYVDMDKFKQYLFEDMERQGLTKSTPVAIVDDYIFLCFMLGNDFLPHQSCLSIRHGGVELLQQLYCETHSEIGYDMIYQDSESNQFTIRTEFLLKIWESLSVQEESLIKKHQKKMMKPHYITEKDYENDFEREKAILEFYPVFHREMEQEVDIFTPGWRERYYRRCFGVSSEKEISNIVEIYCKTLMWTLNYYLDKCPDWNWYYPYRHCPLFQDLIKYVPSDFTSPSSSQKAMTPYQQLLLVLPPSSFPLLPKKYQKYLQSASELTPYFPTTYQLDTYHKNKNWECNPILPLFDLSHLDKISKVGLSRDEKNRIKSQGLINIK